MKRLSCCIVVCLVLYAATTRGESARDILTESGVKGGLVVVVGCDAPALLVELRTSDSYLVHGLDADTKNVADARAYIKGKGLYGDVSVMQWSGDRLPYVDALVNLILVPSATRIAPSEVERVLAPRGVAIIGGKKTIKPWPDDIDQWTHFLHGPDNNPVARDRRVGPPTGLQWICGPLWGRSHEFSTSLPAMVSGGGRVFYVFDMGQTSLTGLPQRWTLLARDAFSGKLLWERELPRWAQLFGRRRSIHDAPSGIVRRIVTDGTTLYGKFDPDNPVEAIDAAAGETSRRFAGTGNVEEMALVDETLVAYARSRVPHRETPDDAIIALNTKTGRQRWSVTVVGRYLPRNLAANGRQVVYDQQQGCGNRHPDR